MYHLEVLRDHQVQGVQVRQLFNHFNIDFSVIKLPQTVALVLRKICFISLFSQLGGMLSTTDLSVPNGAGSSPVGKTKLNYELILKSLV